ncbi:MAG: Asp-tRNA(Asn)/Glu-tRNA(Gln) amidotransferase subunit GatC [Promethearchaeota archaeon]
MINYKKLDIELVRRIAEAAHLNLSDEELEKYSNQIIDILEAFTELDQVNTTETSPSIHPIKLENVLREDISKDWDWDPFNNTKHKEKNYFKGPKII